MKLHVLGTRGSIPTGGAEYIEYGSDTSSYLLMTDEHAIFLDAGSGMFHTPDISGKTISIILSHLHIDHLMGLALFSYFQSDTTITIYSAFPTETLKNAIKRIFSPPLWPCEITDFKANIIFEKLDDITTIGDVNISYMWGNHPNDCAVIKLSHNGKVVVYATDYEHDDKKDVELCSFSKNADLLLYDGQYDPEQYEKFKGYGHSTKEKGLEIADKAAVKKIAFIHLDPRHTDAYLDDYGKKIAAINSNAIIAKQRDVIEL